jgi:putative salt-induced outer membrane protein YdiY
MKLKKLSLLVASIVAAWVLNASAQDNVVTVTNVVTRYILVTNIITITNVAPKVEAPAKKAEPAIAAAVKYPWNSSITAGLTLTRGNSQTLLATAKFLTDKKTPVNEFTAGADVTYGSSSGVENNDTYHAFGQWNHLFSEKWYSYIRGEGLHDGIAQVKYRFTLTAGAGYYFIKQTNTTLAAEVGPGVVAERVGDVDNTYATLRFGERFEHKFNKNAARVWQSVEILPQVDKVSDYIVNFEIGIESSLYKDLALQVYLDDNYNSQPAAGFKRNDVKLVSGITYKF